MRAADTSTSGSEYSGEHSLDSDHDRLTVGNEPSHPPHAHWNDSAPAASPNLGAILGFGAELTPTTRHGPTAPGVVPVSPGASLFGRSGIGTGTGGAKDGSAAAGVAVAGRGGASGARQERDRNRDRSRPGDHSDDMGARASDRHQRARDRPAFSSINNLLVRTTRDSNGVAANHRGDGGAFGSNGPQGFEEAEGDIHSAPHSSATASARYRDDGRFPAPLHAHHLHRHAAGSGASYFPRHPHYPQSAWDLHQQELHHAGQQHPMYGPTFQQQPRWHYHSSGGPFPLHIQHPNHGFDLPPPPPPTALPPHQQHMQQKAPPHSTSVSSSSVPGHTWSASAPSAGSTSKDLINLQSPSPAGSLPFPSSSRRINPNEDASGTIADSHQGTRRPQPHMQQSSAHPPAWPSHPYYHQPQYPQPHYGMGAPNAGGWEEPNPHWHHSRPQPPPAVREPLPPAAANHGDSTATSTSDVPSAPNAAQGSSQRVPQQPDPAQGCEEPRDAVNGLGGTEKLAVTYNPSTQADCGRYSIKEVAHKSPTKPLHRGDYDSGTDRGPWLPSASYNPDTMPNGLNAPSHHAHAWHGPPFHPPPHRHGYSSFGPPPPSAAAAAAGLEAPSRGLEPGDTVFDPITQSTLDQFFPETPSRSSAAGLAHGNDASHGIPGRCPTVSPSAPARGPPHAHSIRQPPIPPTIGAAYAGPDHHAYHHYTGSHYPLPPRPGTHAHYPVMYHPQPPPPPPFPPSFGYSPPSFPVPTPFGPRSPTDYEPPHSPFPHASIDRPDPVSPSRALRPQFGRRAMASKASGGATRKVQNAAAGGGSRSKSRKAAAASSADSDSSESDKLDEDADEYDEDDGDEASDPGRGRRSTAKYRKRAPRKQQGNQVGSTLFVRGKPVDGGQSRSYLVFTREAYAKMVKCLQLAAQGPEDVYSSVELRKEWKDVAASSSVRKRWKRLQFNLQVVSDRQEYRQLAWKSSTLIIAPREDWDDILREAHHSDLPPEQHASVRQTIMSIRDRYETRRSRCGITAEAIDSFCHRCECYRRLLNSIANGSEADALRAAGHVEGQEQAARVKQEGETIDEEEEEDEDEDS